MMPEVRGQGKDDLLINALLGHSNELVTCCLHDLLRPGFLLRLILCMAREWDLGDLRHHISGYLNDIYLLKLYRLGGYGKFLDSTIFMCT